MHARPLPVTASTEQGTPEGPVSPRPRPNARNPASTVRGVRSEATGQDGRDRTHATPEGPVTADTDPTGKLLSRKPPACQAPPT